MKNGKMYTKIIVVLGAVVLLPLLGYGQSPAEKIASLHTVLETLYDEMMPLCEDLTSIAKGLAGFGTLFYIASRVWQHIANAEAIDFYPLFRPFVLGFCILNFTSVLGLINGVMKPTVTGTEAMVKNSDMAIVALLKQKEQAIKTTDAWKMYVGADQNGDRDRWYRYTYDNANPADEGVFASIGNNVRFAMNKAAYNFRNSIKEMMSEILKVLFQAAALCINTLRTFQMVVLSILGPLVFGLSVFDGFKQSLSTWLSKYINVFLWLPVANIFGAIIGKIQENMIKLDLGQIKEAGDTFFSATDTGYLVFMLIGIVGYFTVPTVSNFIINGDPHGSLSRKMSSVTSNTMGSVVQNAPGMAGATLERAGNGALNIANAGRYMKEGYNSGGSGGGASGGGSSGGSGSAGGGGYQAGKLSGQGTP